MTTREYETLQWLARGSCLVRDDDGRPLQVFGALPGERVRVDVHASQWRRFGVVRDVLRPSPDRIAPACRHAATCSGCSLLHVREEVELDVLRLVIAEVLARHAGVPIDAAAVEVVGDARRGDHRVRARLHVGTNGQLGMQTRDGAVQSTPDCMAMDPALRRVARALDGDARTTGLDAVTLLRGVEGVSVTLHAREDAGASAREGAVALAEALRGSNDAVRHVAWACGDAQETLSGTPPTQLPVGDVALQRAVDAWIQPTPARAAALHAWAVDALDAADQVVLDPTCGTGALALRIARTARSVLLSDRHHPAVEAASDALRAAGFANGVALGGKVEATVRGMHRHGLDADRVALNPMREPLGDAAMQALSTLRASVLVLLAPAPLAGARDIVALRGLGWTLDRVAAGNLHPGTGRPMLMARLVRARPAPAR